MENSGIAEKNWTKFCKDVNIFLSYDFREDWDLCPELPEEEEDEIEDGKCDPDPLGGW